MKLKQERVKVVKRQTLRLINEQEDDDDDTGDSGGRGGGGGGGCLRSPFCPVFVHRDWFTLSWII